MKLKRRTKKSKKLAYDILVKLGLEDNEKHRELYKNTDTPLDLIEFIDMDEEPNEFPDLDFIDPEYLKQERESEESYQNQYMENEYYRWYRKAKGDLNDNYKSK